MKISWGHLMIAVVSVALLAGAYRLSPAVRAAVSTQGNEWFGWTEEARRSQSVPFIEHVKHKLEAEVATLRKSRLELVGNSDQLSGKIREQEALRDHARKLAEEFRTAFQAARASQSFPITVRNAAYTEEQSLAQVSLLLAQADGFEQSLQRLQRIQNEANKRVQEIVVRQNATESHLAAIGTQLELLHTRQLTSVSDELIAQVDELLDVNQRVLTDNPVRTVTELLSADTLAKPQPLAQYEAAQRFLEEKPVTVGKPSVADPSVGEPIPAVAKIESDTAPPTKAKVEAQVVVDIEFDEITPSVSVIQEQSATQASPQQK
ncbi:MAG: hypothetical protein U1A77_23770 [Pirellulales bacterium]